MVVYTYSNKIPLFPVCLQVFNSYYLRTRVLFCERPLQSPNTAMPQI